MLPPMPQNAAGQTRAVQGRRSRGPNTAGCQSGPGAQPKGDAMVNDWTIRGMIATALLSGTATLAAAQSAQSCAPREQVVERLATRYGETRQSVGLNSSNRLMEVFASRETGTWTITVTSAEGVTCLVASGQAFQELTEALPVGDPA